MGCERPTPAYEFDYFSAGAGGGGSERIFQICSEGICWQLQGRATAFAQNKNHPLGRRG